LDDACPVCGCRVRSLTAENLIVALTAIPRQFQELLARFGSLDDIDGPLRARDPVTGWSPLERIGHVSDSLHASAKTTVAILDGDRNRFPPVHIDAARAGVNVMPSRAVLAALDAAASDLAVAAPRADTVAWERNVQLGSLASNVREVLGDAVHDAQHHLADVRVALEATVAAFPN
jgi:hypothetical protein